MSKLLKFLIVQILFVSSLFAISIEQYHEIEIKMKELSLEFNEKRIDCLKNSCTKDKWHALNILTFEKIDELHRNYKTTTMKRLVFYTQNKQSIKKYYNENKFVQILYNELDNKLTENSLYLKEKEEIIKALIED